MDKTTEPPEPEPLFPANACCGNCIHTVITLCTCPESIFNGQNRHPASRCPKWTLDPTP